MKTSITIPHQYLSIASRQRPSKPDSHHYTKQQYYQLTEGAASNFSRYKLESIILNNYSLKKTILYNSHVDSETPYRMYSDFHFYYVMKGTLYDLILLDLN